MIVTTDSRENYSHLLPKMPQLPPKYFWEISTNRDGSIYITIQKRRNRWSRLCDILQGYDVDAAAKVWGGPLDFPKLTRGLHFTNHELHQAIERTARALAVEWRKWEIYDHRIHTFRGGDVVVYPRPEAIAEGE